MKTTKEQRPKTNDQKKGSKVKKGYTLIEIILGIVLIAVITYGLGVFIVKGIDAWVLLRERNTLQSEARLVASRMTQNIRNVPTTASISAWTSTNFAFTDVDGQHNFNISHVGSVYSITYNGYSLTDNAVSDGLQFTYLDQNGAAAGILSDIRSIRFKIKLSRAGQNIKVESASRLRVMS